jgi:2-keto-4-pentenoate hydratase/2-oxohepta-3-ene-1,7-dioic acid hydratase in catechol pathway
MCLNAAVTTGSHPFALGTFEDADGRRLAGLVVDASVIDLSRELGSAVTVRGLLDNWHGEIDRLQAIADRGPRDDRVALDGLRPLAPVQPPGQIFQAGANYRKHVLDLLTAAARRGDASDGLDAEARDLARVELDERAKNGRPFVFTGSAHAMVGPLDDIVLPADGTCQHDWELELTAVIGRPGRQLRHEDALDIVAGYMISNDLTTRDALHRPDAASMGLDWLAGKNSPTFLPTGPYLVPARHAGDPMDLQITLRVNGRTMQDESTEDMLFDVAHIIQHISEVSELRPGDLVLTGSPAGNGASHGVFLQPGDIVEGTITGLGTQRNVCVGERQRVA